jgi:hypothetical protein
LVDAQTVGVLVTAASVTIAAIYYIINLRETTKNRRATLTNSIIQPFTTKEFAKDWLALLSMKWDGFDDFQKKYDSRVNPENFALRISFWNLCDSIGHQYRTGLIDIGTVNGVAGIWIADAWFMFGSVIKEYRKLDYPNDLYENFEYLADVLGEMRREKDSDWDKKMEHAVLTH